MPSTKPRQPQDRKPKASEGFTFDHDGETYSLPAPSEALTRIPGRALRDAFMDGTQGELRLAFHCVESVGADPEAIDALYAKSAPEMTEVILSWFRSAEVEGATLPQS